MALEASILHIMLSDSPHSSLLQNHNLINNLFIEDFQVYYPEIKALFKIIAIYFAQCYLEWD
jgi:hypothetical protein